MLPGCPFWNRRRQESFLHMPSKMQRAGTIKDLLSGRVKRRDERKEAAQARKRKPQGKRIERPIVILAGPRETPRKMPRG